jgi:hypothetical protein
MTTLALILAASAVVVGVLVVVIRRRMVRSTGTVDLNGATVSAQWLMQHQSNDRS